MENVLKFSNFVLISRDKVTSGLEGNEDTEKQGSVSVARSRDEGQPRTTDSFWV